MLFIIYFQTAMLQNNISCMIKEEFDSKEARLSRLSNTLIIHWFQKYYSKDRKTFKIMKNLRILGVINFYQRRNTMIKKKSYDEKTFQWIHISWEFWCITYIAAITFFFLSFIKISMNNFLFFFFFMKLYERIQRVIFFFIVVSSRLNQYSKF